MIPGATLLALIPGATLLSKLLMEGVLGGLLFVVILVVAAVGSDER